MLIVTAGCRGPARATSPACSRASSGSGVVSVDPIEAAMWRAGVGGPEGAVSSSRRAVPTGLAAYAVAEAVADGILASGGSVIVDAVNDVEAARAQWRGPARRHDVALRFIEVVCSDPLTHRTRLEGRRRDIPGFVEPTWDAVLARRMAPWHDERLTVDAAGDDATVLPTALAYVRGDGQGAHQPE